MIKHLYKIFADKWYHGGRIFIYSDPHFSELSSYKLRFPELFKEDGISRIAIEYMIDTDDKMNIDKKLVSVLDKMQIDNINKICTKNDTLIILGDVGNTECVAKLKAGRKVLIIGNHDKGATTYFKNKENGLFNEVYEGPLFISDRILLSHEPIELPYVYNIHGHVHDATYKSTGLNCCAEALKYKPVCLDELIKEGKLKLVESIHRKTINTATEKKKKRHKK